MVLLCIINWIIAKCQDSLSVPGGLCHLYTVSVGNPTRNTQKEEKADANGTAADYRSSSQLQI
jgi:hypothetical protein